MSTDWMDDVQRVAHAVRRRVLDHTIKNNGGYLSQACSAAEILATLDNLRPSLPPDITMHTEIFRQADFIETAINNVIKKEIGNIAVCDDMVFAPGLPKTRSGKIMRRILRKIAENELDSLGDTSTLADPAVVNDLIANRPS